MTAIHGAGRFDTEWQRTRRGLEAAGVMRASLPIAWRTILADAVEAPSFGQLVAFVAAERARMDTEIYPATDDVFAALRLTRRTASGPAASARTRITGPARRTACASRSAGDADPPVAPEHPGRVVRGPRPRGATRDPWSHGRAMGSSC